MPKALFEHKVFSVQMTDGGHIYTAHPGAVGILAFRDDNLVLVKQERPAIAAKDYLEIPAGKLDIPGEPKEACARREMMEETGLRPLRLGYLGSYLSSVGCSNERIWIFMADQFEEVERPEADDDTTVVEISFSDVEEMVFQGRITDAKTIAALYFFNVRPLDKREPEWVEV